MSETIYLQEKISGKPGTYVGFNQFGKLTGINIFIEQFATVNIMFVNNDAVATDSIVLTKGADSIEATFVDGHDETENYFSATVYQTGKWTITATRIVSNVPIVHTTTVNVTEYGKIFSANVLFATDLNSCSWKTIKALSDEGVASQYFNVGDQKEIELIETTIGTHTVKGKVKATIIGFNHNAELETAGKSSIHFQIDTAIDSDNQDHKVVFFAYPFGLDINYNNWWSCDLATNTLHNSFINALPEDLVNVMSTFKKYQFIKTGYSSGYYDTTVGSYKLAILSDFEISGEMINRTKEVQYKYYADLIRNGQSPRSIMDEFDCFDNGVITPHRDADVQWLRTGTNSGSNKYVVTVGFPEEEPDVWLGSASVTATTTGFSPIFVI